MGDKWQSLKHYKSDSLIDKWGNPDKIDPFLLMFLDEFRDSIKSPLIVTSGYREKDPGQHGLGRAVDIVAPKWEGSLFDLYLTAERFGFNGIGLYRDWFYNGKKTGGLHLDVRLLVGNKYDGARWTCVRDGADKLTDRDAIMKIPQKYLKLDLQTLKSEGFL